MPRPSRATAHHLSEIAPTATLLPSRERVRSSAQPCRCRALRRSSHYRPICRPSSSRTAKTVFVEATRSRLGEPHEGKLDGGEGNGGGGGFRLLDRRSGLTRLVGHAKARTLGRGLSPIRPAAH